MSIADIIKQYMTAAGISYQEVADRTGYTKQNIWIRLNTTPNPSFYSIMQIIRACGILVEIQDSDGNETDIDIQKVVEAVDEEAVSWSIVERILNAMGYRIAVWLPDIEKMEIGKRK